jgi:AraC-like DNA-binding protein/quercetin dioxygenase-like cupin family protein
MAGEARAVEKRYHLDHSYVMSPRVYGTTQLFQIGRLYCAAGTVVATHSHLNWFELTVATAGKGTVQTNGVSVPIGAGEIYLSFPGDFHGIIPDASDPLKYDFFSFNTNDEALKPLLEELTVRAAGAERRVFCDDRVRNLVGQAIAEVDSTEPFAERLLATLLEQIVLYVLRDFRSVASAKHVFGVGKQEELCYQMMHYIDTHIYTMQGLSEIAEAMRYHYSYLSDLFHQVTGETLLHYYRTRRLEAARLLLGEGKLSVGEVAELLHYASVYTFSRSFKEAFGITPAKQRRCSALEKGK